MFLRPGYQRQMVSNDNRGRVTREKQVTSFSQVEAQARPSRLKFSYGLKHVYEKCFVLSMVESRCVVQWYNNCSSRATQIALHASPADRTRDVWVQFVALHVLLFSRFTSRFEGHSGMRPKSVPASYTWMFGKRVSDQEIVKLKKSPLENRRSGKR